MDQAKRMILFFMAISLLFRGYLISGLPMKGCFVEVQIMEMFEYKVLLKAMA